MTSFLIFSHLLTKQAINREGRKQPFRPTGWKKRNIKRQEETELLALLAVAMALRLTSRLQWLQTLSQAGRSSHRSHLSSSLGEEIYFLLTSWALKLNLVHSAEKY